MPYAVRSGGAYIITEINLDIVSCTPTSDAPYTGGNAASKRSAYRGEVRLTNVHCTHGIGLCLRNV